MAGDPFKDTCRRMWVLARGKGEFSLVGFFMLLEERKANPQDTALVLFPKVENLEVGRKCGCLQQGAKSFSLETSPGVVFTAVYNTLPCIFHSQHGAC